MLTVSVCHAQIEYAIVGINGLTCSQCSRSVEMQLRKLDFIHNVDMDLESTQAKIYFKNKHSYNLDKIASAVKDAGFSVRFLNIALSLDNWDSSATDCIKSGNKVFAFMTPVAHPLQKGILYQVVADNFMTKKEFKEVEIPETISCKGSEIIYLRKENK